MTTIPQFIVRRLDAGPLCAYIMHIERNGRAAADCYAATMIRTSPRRAYRDRAPRGTAHFHIYVCGPDHPAARY